MQLYRVLSIHTPVKQVLHGNCESGRDIVLENYTACLRKKAKCAKLAAACVMHESKERIEEHLSLLSTEFGVQDADHVYTLPGSIHCVVYYFAGYIIHKSKRFTDCDNCLQTMCRSGDDVLPSEALLTTIRDMGYLKHPSFKLYSMLCKVESIVSNCVIQNGVISDLFWHIIDSMDSAMLASVGCSIHSVSLMTSVIHFYIVTRLYFLTRQMNKSIAEEKKVASMRKVAKLK